MEFPDVIYRDICSTKTLYSPDEGFFTNFINVVLEQADQSWIEDVFRPTSSDLDKIRASCENVKVWAAIRNVLKNVCKVYRKKSRVEAEKCRSEAEMLLKLADYKKAVMKFSQSLIRAPENENDESGFGEYTLTLAYKGRAKALYHLGRYKEAIKDLNLALKEKLPDSLRYQIFRQMGECYKGLAEFDKAKISLQIALKLIDEQILTLVTTTSKCGSKSEKNQRDALKKVLNEDREEIKHLMKTEEKTAKCDQKQNTPYCGSLPDVTGARNGKYSSASNLVKIRQSEEAGRFAAAADRIEVGATLVVEEPHASVLISPMLSSHCLHCFTRLYAPVPCKRCSGVAFCSIQCREAADSSYHNYECELMGLFLGSGMSVLSQLSLRMVTQESLSFFKCLLSKIQGSSPPETFSPRESQYIQVYNLATNCNMRTSADFFKRTLMAIFMVECLKKTGYFNMKPGMESDDTFSEDEKLTASIILRHLQLLQFNAHEIYETRVLKPKQTRDAKAVYIAVAIYPTVALFNHECSPTVTRYFNGKSIVIKAVRPLEKNDVLSENYGPNYGKRTLIERRRELTSRYWFNCQCPACLDDWPKVEELTTENLIIRCSTPNCSGTFPKGKLKIKPKSRLEKSCWICSKKTDLMEVLEKKTKLENLFERSLDLMDEGACDEAEPILMSYLNKLFQLVSPPSREMFLAQEALRTCYAQTGNVWVLSE